METFVTWGKLLSNALKSIVKYHHQKTETYFVDDTLQLELFLLHKAM